MSFSMDPLLQLLLRTSLAVLFAAAAAHKLRDLPAFRVSLAAYGLVPNRLVPTLSVVLVACEVIVAIALVPPGSSALAALAGAGLLLLYTGAILINVMRGHTDIDCGCAGPARRQPLGIGLVARNLVLCFVAILSTLPAGARRLIWIDVVTFTAGLAAVCLSYKAIDLLLAGVGESGPRRPPVDEPVLSFEVQNG